MSIESEVVSALRNVERDNASVWSLHAQNLAHGIEKSGVPAMLGELNASVNSQGRDISGIRTSVEAQVRISEQTNSALMALAAVNAAGFEAICRELGETSQLLSGIEQILANPLSTAAAERYRRGIHALSQEWYEPALKELDAAVEQDPFQALSHFARGLALGALGRNAESLAAFKDAITFTGKDPALLPVLAGASILAAQVASALGEDDEARQLLESGAERVPNCPELLLAHARAAGDARSLERALRIAPELSVVAVAGRLPNAVAIAESVATDAAGPVASMRAAANTLATCGLRTPIPAPVPDAMTFHRVWRDSYAAAARNLAEQAQQREARAQQDRLAHERRVNETTPASTEDSAKRSLMTASVALAICAVTLLGTIGYMVQNPHTDVNLGAIVVVLLAFASGIGVLVAGFSAFVDVGSTIQEARLNAHRRNSYETEYSELSRNAERARKDYEAAHAVAVSARDGLAQLNRSVPDRVYPLMSTSAGAVSNVPGGLEQDAAWRNQASQLKNSGQSLQAIKVVRAATGCGLDEAKELLRSL